MLAELHEEQERIGEAIAVLQRIAYGRGKRRGRPPSWITAVRAADGADGADVDSVAGRPRAVKRRGRPPGRKNKAK
jgi:hypothetical protein